MVAAMLRQFWYLCHFLEQKHTKIYFVLITCKEIESAGDTRIESIGIT